MEKTPAMLSRRAKIEHQSIATILAFALIPLSGFATDIYIPSMPSMETALRITSIQTQTTLTMFLISYGVAQLFIGGIVDSFGRYRIGIWSLAVFVVSCLVIANTESIYLIYAMRIVQGVSVAGIVVAKRAYFVDVYSGDKLKGYLSIFTIIWSAGPIIAPFIGGYLQHLFGWESNFYFLGGFALVMLILELIYSGETLVHRTPFQMRKIGSIYLDMVSTPSFALGIGMLALAYSAVMFYNMTGPFIIEHHLSLTPVISGYCSLLLGIAWMAGGFIGKAAVAKPFYRKMLINAGLQLAFASGMLVVFGWRIELLTLLSFAFLIHVCTGFTYNNYFSYSLRRFPKNAGIAGGLTGGIVYVLVSFISYFMVEAFPPTKPHELSIGYLLLSVLSAAIMVLIATVFSKGRHRIE